MLNPLLDTLSDYPFEALRTLLNPVTPVVNDPPIMMSLGEPQHQPPALLTETLTAHAHEWNKYPPMAGTPELRQAIADWLTRRYRLPDGAVDPDRHVLSLGGTKEGLYLFSSLVVPREKAGRRPVVLVPNPYYLVYNGAATMAGAEAVFLDATAENGFMPDLASIPRETWERAALFYLCSPANPQGTIAGIDYLKQAIALARRYDFVLAVDECYAEIWDRTPPPGALEACAALGPGDRFVRQCRRVPFAVEAVERGRAALRLRRRRPGADRAFQASARLRRLSGAAADPGRGGGAVARRGACRGEPRPLSPQIRHRRGRARRPIRLLPAAGRVLSVARCRRRRSRRRCACGARRRSACCRAAIRRAPPRAATIRERAISASRSCTTRRLSKPPLPGSRACCSSGFARCYPGATKWTA